MVLVFPAPTPAPAASTPAAPLTADPAAMRIEAFYPVVLDTMKNAGKLGFEGRATKLRPAIVQLFNIAAMAQFAIGPRWASMSSSERQSVTDALTRYTVRTYARNFDGYSDEQFRVDPRPAIHGLDKLVRTTISSKTSAPVSLSYRMREFQGEWRVIDVYYNAVSQVITQRADFAAVLATGGPAALVRKLDSQTHSLR